MDTYDVAVIGLGALGSATVYQLASRGTRVIGFEQFELGHVRGASHDTSRIIRTSYGAPEYVRLAQSSYRDWAALEQATGERLTSITGGIVSIPSSGPYSATSFATALTDNGVPFEQLSPVEVMSRWPQFVLDDDVETIYTPDSGIANAARTVATLQMHARMRGAELRDLTPVIVIEPDADGVTVVTASGRVRATSVVIAADAWTNQLLDPLGVRIPLEIMQEQVTYFAPEAPADYDRDRFPVWIWEDDQCFYGFPTYGEPSIKAARDVAENFMLPQERTFQPSSGLIEELSGFMDRTIPGHGRVLRTVTCQYALTPDRRFVISALPEHPNVVVGLGAGHAFKFTPTFGRLLADLATNAAPADDVSSFTAEAVVATPA